MELSKAFEMSIEYLGKADPIRVDKEGNICLTDMVKFFPKKRLDNWIRLESTKEFTETVESFLNTSDVSKLKAIHRRRGKYDGGTYAHELLALEFATWLSPEFKLKVLFEYQNGTQRKDNWNIKRVLAAFNYKIMANAIERDHDDPKFYHYSNEAIMINKIVFGEHKKGIRDTASENDLDKIAYLEGVNSTLIDLYMDFKSRRDKLKEFYAKKYSIGMIKNDK